MKLTIDQKEHALLCIIDRMGGQADVCDSRHSWLNWFCEDEVHGKHSDTFNRCNEKGWLFTTHDSDWPDYHTHWTPHPAFPAAPTTEASK